VRSAEWKENKKGNGKSAELLLIPAFETVPNIRHGFTTRANGLGARIGGFKSPDDWNLVADSFGIAPDKLVTVQQVHGDEIVVVKGNDYQDMRPRQADGLVTDSPGIAIGIETADCVPVLIMDPQTPSVAAVHAGWRSTVKRIVQKAVSRMQHEFGSDPSRMIAAIGPAIGPECYEVDEPVMGPVRGAFPFWKEIAEARGNGRWSLDLRKLNSRELVQAGLKERNIHSLGMCTSCRRDLFYSFRAEGRTGRMLSAVMIEQR